MRADAGNARSTRTTSATTPRINSSEGRIAGTLCAGRAAKPQRPKSKPVYVGGKHVRISKHNKVSAMRRRGKFKPSIAGAQRGASGKSARRRRGKSKPSIAGDLADAHSRSDSTLDSGSRNWTLHRERSRACIGGDGLASSKRRSDEPRSRSSHSIAGDSRGSKTRPNLHQGSPRPHFARACACFLTRQI